MIQGETICGLIARHDICRTTHGGMTRSSLDLPARRSPCLRHMEHTGAYRPRPFRPALECREGHRDEHVLLLGHADAASEPVADSLRTGLLRRSSRAPYRCPEGAPMTSKQHARRGTEALLWAFESDRSAQTKLNSRMLIKSSDRRECNVRLGQVSCLALPREAY